MSFLRTLVVTFAALAPLLFFTTPIRADSADDLRRLEKSLRIKNTTNRAKEMKQLLNAQWFIAGSNFARLFMSDKGPYNLIEWLGAIIPSYRPGPERVRREMELVMAEKVYRDEQFNDLTLTVLVPHPKFASVVDLGLQNTFASFVPPRLKILTVENVELRSGFSAKIYGQESGECSLVLTAPRSTLVNLKVKSCSLKAQLLDLAQKLDLERLASKLQT